MDHLLPAAPWLLAIAGVVAGAACLAAGSSAPWQARQMAVVRLVALVVTALVGDHTLVRVTLGVVLMLSAMIGAIGVRGTAAAPMCVHRAAVSVVLAICLWEGLATGPLAEPVEHHGSGLSGVLSVLGVVGVIGVVLWTVVADRVLPAPTDRRAARLLAVESWAMAAGVAVLCLAT
ncbi:hypothetical protein [Microbacterium sp. NPDC089695]|uniref:hypothetical protein n=1 Tax=Microbacterium sp. NPDC089695 TaxID=3364198 RepID=UPI0037F36B20